MLDIRKAFTGRMVRHRLLRVALPSLEVFKECKCGTWGMGFSAEHAGAGLVVDDSTLDVFSNFNNSMFCSLY